MCKLELASETWSTLELFIFSSEVIHSKIRLFQQLAKIAQRRKGVRALYGAVRGGYALRMPRPKRADEKNAIYHALNRGNGRSVIFHEDADYEAFESILAEALVRYPCRILSYQLMVK